MIIKITIGFVVGFIVWTILWLGSDALLTMVPTFGLTIDAEGNFTNIPTNYLIVKIVLSIIFSIIAGLIAATISKEPTKAPLILGFVLLLIGVFVEFGTWNILPLWYHITFLFFLIPAAYFGGQLRNFREVRQ